MENQNTVEVVGNKVIVEAKPIGIALVCEEPKPTDEVIAGWKGKYGDVYELRSEDEELPLTLYCRRPSRQNISRYMKTVFQKDGVQAAHNFLIDTLIYPEKEKVAPLFAEKPGVMITLCTALQETVGMNTHFLATRL